MAGQYAQAGASTTVELPISREALEYRRAREAALPPATLTSPLFGETKPISAISPAILDGLYERDRHKTSRPEHEEPLFILHQDSIETRLKLEAARAWVQSISARVTREELRQHHSDEGKRPAQKPIKKTEGVTYASTVGDESERIRVTRKRLHYPELIGVAKD